jgi:hypothetical protein
MKFSAVWWAMMGSAARITRTTKPINLLARSKTHSPSIFCGSLFDIHQVSAYAFGLLRKGEGPENRLSLMHMPFAFHLRKGAWGGISHPMQSDISTK